MNRDIKRKIERTVFRDNLFTEKVYSNDELPENYSRRDKPPIGLCKEECGNYKNKGELCQHEECFNKLFFSRLEEFNSRDREKFIEFQLEIRKNKSLFLSELKSAVYDSQALFESHVYRHIMETIDSKIEQEQNNSISNPIQTTGKRVFIIHGHDEEMKKAVQLFITRIGLEEVVLHEQADKGRTIIDKLIQESNGACYAIALFSPDDSLEDGSKRARQNVILELGYFIGLIGIERVRILKKGLVEIPSDIQGVIYEDYDSKGNWKINLLKELDQLDIEISKEKVLSKF